MNSGFHFGLVNEVDHIRVDRSQTGVWSRRRSAHQLPKLMPLGPLARLDVRVVPGDVVDGAGVAFGLQPALEPGN